MQTFNKPQNIVHVLIFSSNILSMFTSYFRSPYWQIRKMSSSPANMVHSEGEMCQDCHTLDPLADFVDAAQQHIQSRIRVSSEGFCFRTPRNVFSSPQFQQFLDQGHERNPILRYIYYPDKRLLKIIPTGNPSPASIWLHFGTQRI